MALEEQAPFIRKKRFKSASSRESFPRAPINAVARMGEGASDREEGREDQEGSSQKEGSRPGRSEERAAVGA